MPLYKYSWTPTNDGTGSGLDADLLDGNQATAFATAGQTMHIGTTSVAINRASANLTLTGIAARLDAGNSIFATTSTGSTNTVGRTAFSLATYRSAASAQVGAIVFIAPNTTSTIMHQMEIAGLLYNQNIVRFMVQGYRTTGAWSDLRKVNTGTVDIQVRWGVTPAGNNCLILGDVGTSWSYPHFSIVKAMFSHTNAADAYCTGWTTAVVTDLSSYTQVSETITASALANSISGNANNVTGTVAIANGGTGSTTASAALQSLGLGSPKFVSVRNYGAVGDGSINDTVAIQNAINAVTDGIVFFPPGTYAVSGVVLKPGVSLEADGPEGVNIIPTANNTTLFSYTAPSGGGIKNAITLTGFRLLTGVRTGCNGIFLDGATTSDRISKVRLEHINLEGAFVNAIYLKYCANTFINDIFISASANGVYIDNCADTDIVSVKVQSGSGYGFYINGGVGAFDEGVRLVACSTNGQGYGLGINNQDWGVASACSFTTAPLGAVVAVGSTNWKFSACEFAVAGGTPAQPGVSLNASCSAFYFSSCQFTNNTYGIILRGTNHSVVSSYFIANTNIEIYIDGAQYCTVANNVCRSTAQGSWTILEVGGANHNFISGNIAALAVVRAGANTVVQAAGTATSTYVGPVEFRGNIIANGATSSIGYGTGSGGAVTQITSRTTTVTINKTNGAITLVSAAGTTTWQTFLVSNTTVVATDTVIACQKSGADQYEIHVTGVFAAGFFISFRTTGGTTTEQPVFNFAVIKAVTS